jgi:hypothetical protein
VDGVCRAYHTLKVVTFLAALESHMLGLKALIPGPSPEGEGDASRSAGEVAPPSVQRHLRRLGVDDEMTRWGRRVDLNIFAPCLASVISISCNRGSADGNPIGSLSIARAHASGFGESDDHRLAVSVRSSEPASSRGTSDVSEGRLRLLGFRDFLTVRD